MEWAVVKEQWDLFWTLTHQISQSGILTIFNLSSNVHSPRQEAWLYIFEDNEAVIKMIF